MFVLINFRYILHVAFNVQSVTIVSNRAQTESYCPCSQLSCYMIGMLPDMSPYGMLLNASITQQNHIYIYI
jgi:hypothetical protein